MMNGFGSSNEHQPVTWFGSYPVYAAHLVVAVLTVSMIFTAILQGFRADGLLHWLPFSSEAVWRGEIWRLATYGLFNPPSLWFAIDMLMIVWFGREIERFFGRVVFLRLYLCLYFLTPLLLSVVGLLRPTAMTGQTGGFALFIAFAALYPDAVMLFNLLAKWVALILVGLFSLMALAANDWVRLITLWANAGFAWAYVRAAQGRLSLPQLPVRPSRPKPRVVAPTKTKPISATKAAESNAMAEIDALLDKIAQSGMASLTPKERARLEAARTTLRKRTENGD